MSDPGAPRRDRRKLVLALEHLTRGLREGDDPLYDPWQSATELPPLKNVGPELARPSSPAPLPPAKPEARRRRLRKGAVSSLVGPPPWALVVATALLLFAVSAALLLAFGGAKP